MHKDKIMKRKKRRRDIKGEDQINRRVEIKSQLSLNRYTRYYT